MNGNSVCFLNLGENVIDTTSLYEFELRVNGAIVINNGNIDIVKWNRSIEKTTEHKGTF